MKPSIARMIVRDPHHVDTRGLTGDLFQEVANKNLRLNRFKTGGYEIQKLRDNYDHFFTDIIGDFGDKDQKVIFKELKKRGRVKLNRDFTNWKDLTEEKAKLYFNPKNEDLFNFFKSGFKAIAILSVVLIILGLMFNGASLPLTLSIGRGATAIWAILYFIGSHKFDNLNNDAEQTATELKGLK